MPLYEYKCPSGHVQTEIRKMAERELPVRCACGADAAPILSLPAVGKVAGSKNPVRAQVKPRPTINEIGHSMVLIDWKCPECATTTYEVYDARPEAGPMCACGAQMREVVGVPDVDWFTKASSGSPNGLWSYAAQRFFTSKADRQLWMDKNNLMDGNDVDSDAILRKGSEKRRANDEYCADMCSEFDRDPAIRRLRDEGRVQSWDTLRPGRDIV